jgi:hypothetical protein
MQVQATAPPVVGRDEDDAQFEVLSLLLERRGGPVLWSLGELGDEPAARVAVAQLQAAGLAHCVRVRVARGAVVLRAAARVARPV